jgi:predicted 3-demethylubiquinone-9 3-methyltransferase (glyoxalase superfamily)
MPEITPCLWFDHDLEEAMNFYVSVFPNSRIISTSRYAEDAPPGFSPGDVLAADWELDGRSLRGINGGPVHAGFTETFSLSVATNDQEETDRYWDTLVADGGTPDMCGWLKDRFGLSWQIVPTRLVELISDPDPRRSQAALQAMFKMQKIVIADLEAAVAAV